MFDELISNLSNIQVFTESLHGWVSGLSVNSAIIFVMMLFMLLGAVDKIRGNKWGYGEEFDNGFNAMGPLAIAMAGVVAAAPVLAIILKPIIVPIYGMVGSDAGVLAGLITVPLGCIAGGLLMNMTPYKIDLGTILVNLIPVIIIAGLICIGLWFKPQKMINGFNVFGTAVTILITILTAVAVFEYQTGIHFPLFDKMVVPAEEGGSVPLEDGLLICGQIATVLIGAFPMVKWITRTFGGALETVGRHLGMNEDAAAGMVANLANNIAMFNIFEKMDPKGKLLNVAFTVSAAFVFGDHLGFTAGANPEMIFPVVVGKLVAGITAVILANFLAPMLLAKIKEAKA